MTQVDHNESQHQAETTSVEETLKTDGTSEVTTASPEIEANEVEREVSATSDPEVEVSPVQDEQEAAPEVVDPVVELTAKNAELEDQLLRMQAEIQNMRRIHTRERQDAAKYRSQNIATSLLDVVDNLERALATSIQSEDAIALHKGVEMVQKQFLAAFEKEAITVIDPLNQPFDPNYHQAVSVMPLSEGQEADTVVNVLQKGYQLHDRVLRPAMVIVAQ